MLFLHPRERSLYEASPLGEVICQIRFPKLLALENSLPVDFQKIVGSEYPILETRSHIGLSQTAQTLDRNENARISTGILYDFFDEDRQTKITLTSDFIAISTLSYTRWEDFCGRISTALNALKGTYDVHLFLRIGLRYQNVIRPNELGLTDASPSDLIEAALLGLVPHANKSVSHHSSTTFRIDDSAAATVQVVIPIVENAASSVYVIDTDTFEDAQIKAEVDGAVSILDKLHKAASDVFRCVILERLHNALGPKPCGTVDN